MSRFFNRPHFDSSVGRIVVCGIPYRMRLFRNSPLSTQWWCPRPRKSHTVPKIEAVIASRTRQRPQRRLADEFISSLSSAEKLLLRKLGSDVVVVTSRDSVSRSSDPANKSVEMSFEQ